MTANQELGAIYLAFNGPQYPGYGPNIIKEFRPDDYDSVDDICEGHIDVKLYPVPATNNLNINVSDELIGGSYIVVDYHGKTVLEGSVNSSTHRLDVNNLARGSYYILLQNKDTKITRTFTLN